MEMEMKIQSNKLTITIDTKKQTDWPMVCKFQLGL